MITDRVMRKYRGNEIARDQKGTLGDQLIKCMLAVGSRFPPNDGAGGIGNLIPIAGCMLTITFHIALLEISRETVHVLVVGQYGLRLCPKKINIQKTYKPHYHGYILFE